jgi:hypothetical protein
VKQAQARRNIWRERPTRLSLSLSLLSIQSVPLSLKPKHHHHTSSHLSLPLPPTPLRFPHPTRPPPLPRPRRFPGDSARFGADSGLPPLFPGESAGIGPRAGGRSGPPLPIANPCSARALPGVWFRYDEQTNLLGSWVWFACADSVIGCRRGR